MIETVTHDSLKASSWQFFGLCAYLLSQAFTIPIFAVGPSWALWPTLSDFAGWFLVAATLVFSNSRLQGSASRKQKTLLSMIILIIGGCTVSYITHYTMLNGTTVGPSTPREISQYQLYRLVQFGLLYWATINISLSPKRLEILKKLLPWVLTVVCLGLILEFLGIVNSSVYAAHLPMAPRVAGAWSDYVRPGRFGRGTISYDHAYSSVQVLLLLALSIHLRSIPSRGVNNRIGTTLLTILAMVAIWTTGCRAVMLASLLFLGGLYFRKLVDLAKVLVVLAGVVVLTAAAFPEMSSVIYGAVSKQSEIRETYDVDGVGGRGEIWRSRISFLGEDLSRLVIGGGIGSDTSGARWPGNGNAHNLYLEVLVEHGFIGLSIFIWVIIFIVASVYRRESAPRGVFWASIAILVASFAQVTLYPIPWTGQFIGFYLCTIAIALRKTETEPLRRRALVVANEKYSNVTVCIS